MLKLIQEMARDIERDWTQVDNSVYQFSEIALRHIEKRDLVGAFDFHAINELLDDPSVRQVQIASEFSELHFKLFDNGRFYIEILNWWDKDTSIHDHGFAGVLVQLRGAALNALYSFDNEDTSTSQTLRFGDVRLTGAEISRQGGIRVIPYGRTERHAVFHLVKPTISLIVRTHPVDDISPQLNYFAPYLMSNHSAAGVSLNKRIKYFKLLADIDPQEFRQQLLKSLCASSSTECFWLLMKLAGHVFHPRNVEVLSLWKNDARTPLEQNRREKLIASVACRRASQFIADQVKPHFSDEATRLLLAAVASAYTKDEREFVFRELKIEQPEERLEAIASQLPSHLRHEFSNAVKLLGGNWNL